jgi:hypothetical protein
VTGEAVQLLSDVLGRDASVERNGVPGTDNSAAGLIASVATANLEPFVDQFVFAIAQHRFPEREGSQSGIGVSRERAG